ncbi:MAG: hypothetical protein JWM59_4410 [Verrucomicrobiales bacterium]|nr:hypothetical protein [Verrucomicrobiales bacterium]
MRAPTLVELLFNQISDLHRMETLLSDTLPGLAARARHSSLYALIAAHAMQTPRQLELLDMILRRHGSVPGNGKCKAMRGLTSGMDARLGGVRAPQARDLVIMAHCVRIERYEITVYSLALRLARKLDMGHESVVLDWILAQEMAAARGLEALEPVLFQLAEKGGRKK